MKLYNKLVRDKISQIIKKAGKKPITKLLSQKQYKEALDHKLKEEIIEYSKSKSVEELADIQEVILAILKSRKILIKDFDKLRKSKVRQKGGFNKRIKLIKVED